MRLLERGIKDDQDLLVHPSARIQSGSCFILQPFHKPLVSLKEK
jgi:hypothetical protein